MSEAGLAVDLPVKASTKPGRQFLLYRFREDAKLADICLEIELGEETRFSVNDIVEAQRELDLAAARVALATLSPPTPASREEPIHQLFHHRLVDPDRPERLGGRYRQFYAGQRIGIGDRELEWDGFENLRWVVNGIAYRHSLRELFLESLDILAPASLAKQPAIVSHGNSHNANIWVSRPPNDARLQLTFFDPAFAGRNIPALLGEIKATFHNIFAHPFWLYTPQLAERTLELSFHLDGDRIIVEHNWALGNLRRQFLDSKLKNYWEPLLAALTRKSAIPENWERIMRAALFCCPTLVMKLLPNAERSVSVSLLGFAIAVACGSAPVNGRDDIADLFAKCGEAVGGAPAAAKPSKLGL